MLIKIVISDSSISFAKHSAKIWYIEAGTEPKDLMDRLKMTDNNERGTFIETS